MERSQNKVRSPTMGQLDPPFGRTSQDSSTGSTNQRVSGAGTGLLMERSQNKVRSPTMGHLDPPFGRTSQDSSTGSTNQRVSSLPLASSGKDFFLKHKVALEQRLPSLNPILSKFQERKVLNDQEREEVMSKSTSAERNLVLLTMIQNKGVPAQQVFYKVLKEADPYLVKDLER
ncbi:caspase recruitment domain-containing protein 8-like [Clupea harengus]|uniref:Caspase recruitment domain-containing protein 8-like n=1 Tax=Clupea harengus TaxID=7950 RepID=A0A6P8FZX8_CLUHA|nr:caspase recruitment domain-containing protein 8-like [Clupea harengus]